MKPAAVHLGLSDLADNELPRLRDGDALPPPDYGRPHSDARDFDALYRSQAPRLLRMFARRTGRDEATDLVNETFARLIKVERRLTGTVERPASYLSRIASNLLKDRARSAQRASGPHLSFDEAVHGQTEQIGRLDGRDALNRLHDAVARLRPRTREIFLLHRVEGLTYAQIADEVGMSVKGVKKQMAKALFELRRELGPL